MTLNDLLKSKGIDPEQVVVMRHKPREAKLNKVLPWLAGERPDVFNAYQQVQNERVERVLQKVKYVASFLARGAGRALFVGLYRVNDWTTTTIEECSQKPAMAELLSLGMTWTPEDRTKPTILWFDLALEAGFYPAWKGRLIVNWPKPERSWWRRAHNHDGMAVIAIREESAFDSAMPSWNELSVTWDELRVLPTRWQAAIQQWRGIYYIFDSSDGKGYVGSASGGDNILGRWHGYSASGHGGNKHLKERDPKNFVFTILQRVSPDMPADEVIHVENTWKKRLHSRYPVGLNDN